MRNVHINVATHLLHHATGRIVRKKYFLVAKLVQKFEVLLFTENCCVLSPAIKTLRGHFQRYAGREIPLVPTTHSRASIINAKQLATAGVLSYLFTGVMAQNEEASTFVSTWGNSAKAYQTLMKMTPFPDGYLTIVSSLENNVVQKWFRSGTIDWMMHLGFFPDAIAFVAPNHFVLTGGGVTPVLLKGTLNGDIEWVKTSNVPYSSNIYFSHAVFADRTDTYIVVGSANYSNLLSFQAWSQDGVIQSTRTLNAAGSGSYNKVISDPNGYIGVGFTHTSYYALLLQKWLPDFSIAWTKTWKCSSTVGCWGNSIQVTTGGYIVTGGLNNYPSFSSLLQKWFVDGTLDWAQSLTINPGYGPLFGYDIQVTSDGYVVVAGDYEHASQGIFVIQKWSLDGALIWVKKRETGILGYAPLYVQTRSDGYLIMGGHSFWSTAAYLSESGVYLDDGTLGGLLIEKWTLNGALMAACGNIIDVTANSQVQDTPLVLATSGGSEEGTLSNVQATNMTISTMSLDMPTFFCGSNNITEATTVSTSTTVLDTTTLSTTIPDTTRISSTPTIILTTVLETETTTTLPKEELSDWIIGLLLLGMAESIGMVIMTCFFLRKRREERDEFLRQITSSESGPSVQKQGLFPDTEASKKEMINNGDADMRVAPNNPLPDSGTQDKIRDDMSYSYFGKIPRRQRYLDADTAIQKKISDGSDRGYRDFSRVQPGHQR